MAANRDDRRDEPRLRYEEIDDPEFQKRWLSARHLSWDQVEGAFRHGLEAGDRFGERPFREIEHYLRESWEGMGPQAPWDDVQDIVRSGYRLGEGGTDMGAVVDLPPDALAHFPERTTGGSVKGGTMGEQTELGAAEPASEFEGEGGSPVAGDEDAPDAPPTPRHRIERRRGGE